MERDHKQLFYGWPVSGQEAMSTVGKKKIPAAQNSF